VLDCLDGGELASLMVKRLIVGLMLLGLNSAFADSLLHRMEGKWRGYGSRYTAATGKTLRLEAEVLSTIKEGRLISRNKVREFTDSIIEDPSEPKESTKIYWVRPEGTREGIYLLGYGTGDVGLRPSASGRFDGKVFEVRQNVGGNPPFVVESITEFFGSDRSVYVERAWHGDSLLNETRMEYIRDRSMREPDFGAGEWD